MKVSQAVHVSAVIVPNQQIDAFIAHFCFTYDNQEIDVYEFLAPLNEGVTGARMYLDTGTPLQNAFAVFLRNVILTTQH